MKWGDTPYRINGFGLVRSNMGGWGFSISVPKTFADACRAEKRTAATESILGEHCKLNWPRHISYIADDDGKLNDFYRYEISRAYRFEDDTLLLRSISVPGDACGLDPGDGLGSPWSESFDWLPHNVDSQGQATALLHMWLYWFDAVEATIAQL